LNFPTPESDMTHAEMRNVSPIDAKGPPGPIPDAAALRLRAVHRAVSELKRGIPVLLAGTPGLVVLPAETAGARGLRELTALAATPPVLLLASGRAATILRRPVPQGAAAIALRLSPAMLVPEILQGLADPTVEQMLPGEADLAGEVPSLAESAIALAKLARLLPAMLVATASATATAADDAAARAGATGLLSVLPADILAYPTTEATEMRRLVEVPVPLEGAPDARIVAFRAPDAGLEHLAILVGHPEGTVSPLVRLHSECFTGDLLGSLRCDCGAQLRGAIKRMAAEGSGVLLYLAQEGRGIGLVNKLRAYAMQDRGLDTVDANHALGWGIDERSFLVAAKMLEDLGIGSIRLLTNNPDKVAALTACGMQVLARESHSFAPNGVNDLYLATKMERLGHLLG
jgi:GTP cyclohydrolase II